MPIDLLDTYLSWSTEFSGLVFYQQGILLAWEFPSLFCFCPFLNNRSGLSKKSFGLDWNWVCLTFAIGQSGLFALMIPVSNSALVPDDTPMCLRVRNCFSLASHLRAPGLRWCLHLWLSAQSSTPGLLWNVFSAGRFQCKFFSTTLRSNYSVRSYSSVEHFSSW